MCLLNCKIIGIRCTISILNFSQTISGNEHCKLHTVSAHCILHTAHCTLYTCVQCTQHTEQNTAYCTLYTAHCSTYCSNFVCVNLVVSPADIDTVISGLTSISSSQPL